MLRGGPAARLVCRDGVAVLPDPHAPQVEILRAFVGHVAGGPPPKTSAREGAAAVACLCRLWALAGLEAAG